MTNLKCFQACVKKCGFIFPLRCFYLPYTVYLYRITLRKNFSSKEEKYVHSRGHVTLNKTEN